MFDFYENIPWFIIGIQYFIMYVLIMSHDICTGMPRALRLFMFPFAWIFALAVVMVETWDWLWEK